MKWSAPHAPAQYRERRGDWAADPVAPRRAGLGAEGSRQEGRRVHAFISRLVHGQSGLKLENIQKVAAGLDMDFFNLIRRPLSEDKTEAAITREVRLIVEDRLGPDIG